jgi:hypothetical protein
MQVVKGIRRDTRCPKRHCGADARVKHPLREYCYDACFDLSVDNAPAGALLAVVSSNTPAVKRMPTIVNYNFSPDMGRMTA